MTHCLDDNYVVYHLHSHYSNGTTNIDSITKPQQYINKAKELGMSSIGFSEHGNIFAWYKKKKMVEEAGMKYIHAIEAYITANTDIENKSRDNYHCVLIAKNTDGLKELNELTSLSFNKKDIHFYYVPRITYDELKNTSDNIIITTACLGGILNKASDELQQDFIKFLAKNNHRCYLEIQHHKIQEQKEYNLKLWEISKKTSVPLIAGTDTHCLDEVDVEGRKLLQKEKKYHSLMRMVLI